VADFDWNSERLDYSCSDGLREGTWTDEKNEYMDTETLLDSLPQPKQVVLGRAELHFESPVGVITGSAELDLFTERRPRVKVHVETFTAEPPYDHSVVAFLAGTALPNEQGRTTFAIGGIERRFASLVIETDLGNFSASTGIIWPDNLIGQLDVTATIADLTFTPPIAREPRYWLAPLIGPFAEFKINLHAHHPLALPDRWIYFFKERTCNCGIQPLRSDKNESEFAFDALVFGDLPQGKTATDPSDVIPAGLLTAISFAVGAELQMPYIEVRDFKGSLVRRFFLSSPGKTESANGQVFSLIHGTEPGSGIGAFLTYFFSQPDAVREQLTVVMNLIRSGAPGGGPIEDNITDLVKALDNLVRFSGFAQQNLLECLDPERVERVMAVVERSRDQIRSVRESIRMTADRRELMALDRILERIRDVARTDRHFGIAIGMLLKRLGLFDAEVLEHHCISNGRTYEQFLSAVRGQVIHEGHLGKMNRRELRAWFEFARHLHDLCKRIVLKLVGYTGTYQASNVVWRDRFTLDRIGGDMQLSDLGFSSGLPQFNP
jgi:hypothetical protein